MVGLPGKKANPNGALNRTASDARTNDTFDVGFEAGERIRETQGKFQIAVVDGLEFCG
jgi:non-canonical (house-cleaning) NTP pyrophosphatase